MTFKDILSRLSRSRNFQQKKIQDFQEAWEPRWKLFSCRPGGNGTDILKRISKICPSPAAESSRVNAVAQCWADTETTDRKRTTGCESDRKRNVAVTTLHHSMSTDHAGGGVHTGPYTRPTAHRPHRPRIRFRLSYYNTTLSSLITEVRQARIIITYSLRQAQKITN